VKRTSVNLNQFREAAARRGDYNIAQIARRIGKSRWALYHLHLCPVVLKKLKDTYGV
jgi:ABC-type uncharacterized transport system YnjBCD permease subunit